MWFTPLAPWQKLSEQEVRFGSDVEKLQGFKESIIMKSYGFLFEKLIDKNNILLAIKNSSKRKRERNDVRRVMENPEPFIKRLQRIFIEGDFKIRPHKAVKIIDGNSKKERYIIQPDYIFEQIIHHAVIQILKPILMRGMYDFSCGSIPGRGGTYGKKYL